MGQFEASLVLMAYNQAPFIREAVSAAFAQEGPPIEIVLSDDASSDETFGIMQQMTANYAGPHKVFLNRNTQNLGIVAHYAKAVSMTSGRWIVQADGDDVSAPNRVVRLMQEARSKPDASVIVSWFQVLHGNGKAEPSSLQHHCKMQRMQHWGLLELLSSARRGHGNYILLGAAAAWRRDVFEAFPPFGADKDLYEDSILRWRALLLGRSYIIDDVLISYRRHEGSITNWGGLVNRAEAERRQLRILERSQKCWKFARGDFIHACSSGLITADYLCECLAEIDEHIGYLQALINWPTATLSERTKSLLRYWRFGFWRYAVRSLRWLRTSSQE